MSQLEQQNLEWWAEIVTDRPLCTYYFGPFATAKTAKLAQLAHIEDFEQEGSKIVFVAVRRCQSQLLTSFEDE
ncbi:MAG: hypothetical protein CLLPBCKN_001667 [Chroococcidiopsis cubana SAG 39.79]|jgi:hypothetical protein|uniref:DUF1816 domain-containing protein n=2 Tax=Chroococcidiopsis TaxID=54298 RepID=K9TZQ6_CHRTP|nr:MULTISPECIES: DUF1816 domain-containing protein [Chroococcidiopsis]MBE9016754.1 DUF1816 domain-containing protein [Chroococcidiopsidales cyanobacterium LEGE 13417]AFY88292.1 protein of unknown function DUF1816 [Chroococcidiopsis thermalis PCC 7203]MDV2992709.1 hypothetical protein [Chroococcidiopsis sp. SAG 2025]MDZ4872279.1 hypothetical protein [Chroococcidiopsis cubana SAG 39.79]PSB52101.1 DUF1816 domain-containing protein [Chroococcidiopsis cubana CCALA 043]